ncbi:MAG: 4Fe-4S dicluster domain-containing protein [Chloroflexota bacterium]
MDLSRKNFLKVLGATGMLFAAGKKADAAPAAKDKTEFNAILYDSTRCGGCQTCEYSCAEANGLPDPTEEVKAGVIRNTDEHRRTVVNAFALPSGEAYLKKQCMHCNEPACASACLTQAMYKTKEGPVIWREDKCMGCRYCMVSCPFDIPKFEYNSPNPKIVKCTMCYDRMTADQKPACVENCPAEALVFGTRRELITEAKKRIVENPGQYYDHIYGEHEAGGTSFLYLSAVPFSDLGLKQVQSSSYPSLSKGFLYSVPAVFVLWPAMLLGLREATKNNNLNKHDDEQ